ncbi:tetratricopeptide repeat protein [Plantibacter flavus]|uniref:tetratricopeptide repeat protein n=1 Tax=Plantibacter flavus TaxID=150123 RepID=UPI003F170E78
MNEPLDLERAAIEHDRDLAWELFDARPQHPQIPQLTQSVLARAPQFTGMIILLAMHRRACGEVDEARRLLHDLLGRRDRQYLGALRTLRDLELAVLDYPEALRLAELVLREDPDADWLDRMELASATAMAVDPETGWAMLDDAVEFCGRTEPDRSAGALGQRSLRFLSLGAPPMRFLEATQQAIEADPSETLLATALAYAYLFDYRPEEAKELLLRVLRQDPTDEVAQGGMIVARAFLDPIERGVGTMQDLRNGGMGEIAWRILRDTLFGTGTREALEALETVMPDGLARSLRPGLDREAARASGGDDKLLEWRDGQIAGSGGLWGDGTAFRLMTGREIRDMDQSMEEHPEDWLQWDGEHEYFTQLLTDDAGAYLFEGAGGRLIRRAPGVADQDVAPSFADWLWDRVAAFGGDDARPGRRSRAAATASVNPGPPEAARGR